MVAVGVNRNVIYRVVVSLIVLNYFLGTKVMHRDGFGLCWADHTLLSGVKFDARDWILETLVLLNAFALLTIPNHQFLVLPSRSHQSRVAVHSRRGHPVCMTDKWSLEFERVNVPEFHRLVITGRQDISAVIGKLDRSNSWCMTLYRLCLYTCPRVP